MSASQEPAHPSTLYTKDAVLPFLVNESNVRGRIARLEDSLDPILKRHDYPDAVSKALAELLVIASMLASNLKEDGVFTIQVSGDGPVPMFVADAVYGGAIRGCAEVKGEVADAASVTELTGKGYIAITLDQGGERYQGVVELEGDTFSKIIEQYFVQSQQIDTFIRARVEQSLDTRSGEKTWIAGGLLIERMPEGEGDVPLELDEAKQRWEHALALSHTVKDNELLDVDLGLSDLLFRLYHEDGVWIYDAQAVRDECRCSRKKVESTLTTLPRDEVFGLLEEGEVAVHCHFCNTHHRFDEAALEALFA